MSCTHLVIYRSSNGHHYCGNCGAHLAVAHYEAGERSREGAVKTLIDAARMFAKVTRSRRKDLYYTSFQTLDAAARALDDWYGDPALPEPRTRAPQSPDK